VGVRPRKGLQNDFLVAKRKQISRDCSNDELGRGETMESPLLFQLPVRWTDGFWSRNRAYAPVCGPRDQFCSGSAFSSCPQVVNDDRCGSSFSVLYATSLILRLGASSSISKDSESGGRRRLFESIGFLRLSFANQ